MSNEGSPINNEVLELAHQLDFNLECEDITHWMNVDNSEEGYQLLSDEDLIKQITETDNTIDKEDRYEDVPSSREVKDMLDKCLLWYERQDECTSTSLLLLKSM